MNTHFPSKDKHNIDVKLELLIDMINQQTHAIENQTATIENQTTLIQQLKTEIETKTAKLTRWKLRTKH